MRAHSGTSAYLLMATSRKTARAHIMAQLARTKGYCTCRALSHEAARTALLPPAARVARSLGTATVRRSVSMPSA